MLEVLRKSDDGGASFWCPGCEGAHHVTTAWEIDFATNTISPSVLVTHRRGDPPVTSENIDEWHRKPWKQTIVDETCHSFVRNGRIEFLSDCYHKLAGQTVDLKPF